MLKLKWVPFFLASGYTSFTRLVSSFRVASILKGTHGISRYHLNETLLSSYELKTLANIPRCVQGLKCPQPHHVYICSSLEGTLPRANSSALWCRPLLVVNTRSRRGQVCSENKNQTQEYKVEVKYEWTDILFAHVEIHLTTSHGITQTY